MPTAADCLGALDALGLVALAEVAPDPAFCPADSAALVLVGPQGGAVWWGRVTQSPEWRDGLPDPLDRWSQRHLTALARRFGGKALFPSEGPPWPPFFRWAMGSGRLWQSPVGMLVHADQGLWVSFRGALALPFALGLPGAINPCLTCAEKPCISACPVGALSTQRYDTDACHRHLDQPEGAACLGRGCAARRACPAGESHARMPGQSAYHMSRFHP